MCLVDATHRSVEVTLLTLVLLATLFQKVPLPADPEPIEPDGGTVADGTVTFETATWICQLRGLDRATLEKRLITKGADPALLRDGRIVGFLDELVAFEIAFKNLDGDNLVFNPDQTVLRSGGTIEARLIRTFDLLPVGAPPTPALERLANIFSTTSFQVPTGEVRSQLLVFKPLGSRFPKRLSFVLQNLYQGSVDNRIACRFRIGYVKR